MAFMEWTPEMSVGLAELDDDHKMLVRVINQLATNTGQAGALRQCIFALMRYAEFHFAREEHVMQACGFTALPEHKLEHEDFTAQIQALAKRFEEDPEAAAPEINEKLLDYLKNWLTHHILIVDMAYRPLVEDKPEARRAAQAFKAAELWRAN
ncbi:MAG: bacteriohemerythrin [Kiloniellales bacterium]|nr:bacteriohemerythrin [Kiloniellales bacterium]